MAIIAKDAGGNFTPHPEGRFRAVCVDVVDKGIVETTWQGKTRSTHKIRVVFQTDEMLDNGKPAIASRSFTLSLGEKSALRPFLESWRGKAFTPDELKGFDVEKLIGVGADIQIVHEHKGDKVYDNIKTIMKPMKGAEALVVRDYIRVQDRQPVAAGHDGPPIGEPPDDEGGEDSWPF